jgi:hypothetical protein
VHATQIPAKLLGFLVLRRKPLRQFGLEGTKFASTVALWVLGLYHFVLQILANGISGQSTSPGDFPNRHAFTEMPAPNYA